MAGERKAHNESIILSALKVGAFAGAGGFLFGGTVSILRASPTPILFTTAASIQWALLGSTFYGMRAAILSTREPATITPTTLTYASSIAGTLSFASIGAITRGRANVLPGALMGGLAGFAGQNVYSYFDERHTESLKDEGPKMGVVERVMSSKWFPLRKMSDEEYLGILEEKLWKIKAEIAIREEDLAKLKGKGEPNGGVKTGDQENKLKANPESEQQRKKVKRREG